MEGLASSHADGTAPPGFLGRLLWILVLLGLVAWQGWMTLTLFGPDRPWQRLLDDEPIISGRHPLHLYHGYLGARSLRERGSLCCYDPAFQAGYPKTPVFDSGSRPAEVFLSLVGGDYRPAAYKLGLAISCCAVPLVLFLAARGIGLGLGPSCLASALGLLVWWGNPCRALLEAGDLDLLLAVLAAVVHAGLLSRFHRDPGAWSWLGLLGSGCLGWFGQPLLFLILVLPLFLVYYLTVGAKHRLSWHLALLIGVAGGVAVNAFWLVDLVDFWWIRMPLPVGQRLLEHRTLFTFWATDFWGGPADRALALALFVSGGAGIVLFNQDRQRATARLLGMGMGGLLGLALAGLAWEPLGRLGTSKLLAPALWFALLPAVHAWIRGGHFLARWTGAPWRAAVLASVALLAGGWFAWPLLETFAHRTAAAAPLSIGLGQERRSLIEALAQNSDTQARILWQDEPGQQSDSHWPALLPLLTGRAFLGGLDPETCVEHAYAGFVGQNLAGRPVNEWTDTELEAFCTRYNLGWVVCWTPAAVARFEAWHKGAAPTLCLTLEGRSGCLFTLKRPRSFVLKGQASWILADSRHISLGDLVPEDGRVVLSLHYQAGLHASPSQVQVEREPDPNDPIPFVRLRVTNPVTRVTLSWQDP